MKPIDHPILRPISVHKYTRFGRVWVWTGLGLDGSVASVITFSLTQNIENVIAIGDTKMIDVNGKCFFSLMHQGGSSKVFLIKIVNN